ncbi:hypothetical protein ACIBJE_24290 [Micromonospora sp. NPDC050187]|uniref:hypothetical protein n=1 Tax=Micromonospora sp. NPDC050187 TaxID=3364277 RepID=UPI00379659D5
MPELQQLELRHAPALLRFERENRAYFARFVPDRGDSYCAPGSPRSARSRSTVYPDDDTSGT